MACSKMGRTFSKNDNDNYNWNSPYCGRQTFVLYWFGNFVKLAILIFLSSCSKVSAEMPVPILSDERCNSTLHLEIDNLFNKYERLEILKAIVNWRAASNNQLCFKIVWRNTKYDESSFRSDRKFVIYSWKRSWQIKSATIMDMSPCPTKESCLGVTVWEYGGGSSDIFVLTSKMSFICVTVEHELGHVFGLKHTLVYNSIMYRNLRSDKKISKFDQKNLNCLLKTQTLLQNENDCMATE